ncbi:hypothetical protein ABL78_2252 [Leptomonas seymouri]|uniref:Anoctamin transmembrane domain-containing protein n=1 Tax=Leptomonas seymouri TaxID=5684 RepID=A0A0N1PDJ1_LEPSE|nr:hypothetical protein ABL78_2252 [Leptomonas seymouri]|eukprot:KPI88648.1 hypothetical protein ABL78_2252 [Leptomonas seymouri]
MKASAAPSRHRAAARSGTDIMAARGVAARVNAPTLPLPTDVHITAVDRKKREAELQRQQRAPSLTQVAAVSDIPRCVAPRSSMCRSSEGPPSIASTGTAKSHLESLGSAIDAAASKRRVDVQIPNGARTVQSMTRAEQEEMRMREVERLNKLEKEKARPTRVSNAKEIAAAAADARQQLGQPSYVAIAAQKVSAEAQFGQSYRYTQVVADLHQSLGLTPASHERAQQKDSKGAPARRRLASPANVVEDVADKVVALRRAEMAEMIARLRRLLAEGNVTSAADEIRVIPAAGITGLTSTPCPACDFCIEMTSEDTILKCFIPVLKSLASERVAMPLAGRCGSVSVTSSAVSDNATTLDSFRVHSRRKEPDHSPENGSRERSTGNAQQQLEESYGPSRYAVPRCFRIEVVPFGLRKVSIHVSVHAYLAEHFFKAHAQRQERLFSLSLDPPYPEAWGEWTAAHRSRLLYRVLDDLLHGGPHPPVPSVTEDIVVFPAHVDITRDALWSSVWESRSLSQLLAVPEDAIANYFGAEVMFYYAWMNHYAHWLLGAGVLGVVVSVLSSVRLVDPAVISSAHMAPDSTFAVTHFTIFRYLQQSLDTALLPAFIVVMITGSVLCIKGWERRLSFLSMKYRLFQQEDKDEPRRDFHGTPGCHPVTGEPQLVYPAWYRAVVLQPLAWAIVMIFILITIVIMVCSLNLDGMVNDPSSRLAIPFLRQYTVNGNVFDATVHPHIAKLPCMGYSVCISILSFLFSKLAMQLTQMENYRFRGEYVRALMLKRVVFEFVNSYAKLFFIAFGRGSMPELASNLQSILYVAVLSRLVTETVLPFFVTHRQRVARHILQRHEKGKDEVNGATGKPLPSASTTAPRAGSAAAAATTTTTTDALAKSTAQEIHGGDVASPLNEVDELLDSYDVYMDFLEMIIQFGYILLFAVAYPLASFIALLSNIIEVRSDLFKLCYVVRRPTPRLGLKENATLCGVMRAFAMAAVITNTFLLAFTSHQMARWFPDYFVASHRPPILPYSSLNAAAMASLASNGSHTGVMLDMIPGKGRVLMFYSMLLEHVMGLTAMFLLWRIPSTPRAVRHYKARRLYERMSRC